ncbi:MAG: hypothetical protein GY915_09100 [bacterium]|nr:hypothetical protein [bacterium]
MHTEGDRLDYDVLVQDALRHVARSALKYVAENGLPGSHHFYITFRTHHPGVVMPGHLKAKHPEDITVVIQHQFWDLNIFEDRFSISLSFNDVQENLEIPFSALISFMDPSVKFGLQFTPSLSDLEEGIFDEDGGAQGGTRNAPSGSNVVTLDTFRKKK